MSSAAARRRIQDGLHRLKTPLMPSDAAPGGGAGGDAQDHARKDPSLPVGSLAFAGRRVRRISSEILTAAGRPA